MAELRCPKCGKLYHRLAELRDVRTLGLALMANCPACGKRFGAESLWVRIEVQDERESRIQQQPAR